DDGGAAVLEVRGDQGVAGAAADDDEVEVGGFAHGDEAIPAGQPPSSSLTAARPSHTSTKVVDRGARPSRRPSGARKSGMTPRAHNLVLTSRKSGCRRVM